MHSMNEAIDQLGKVLYITEKRLYPIIKRSFPKMEVAVKALRMIGHEIPLKKMVIFLLEVFRGCIAQR